MLCGSHLKNSSIKPMFSLLLNPAPLSTQSQPFVSFLIWTAQSQLVSSQKLPILSRETWVNLPKFPNLNLYLKFLAPTLLNSILTHVFHGWGPSKSELFTDSTSPCGATGCSERCLRRLPTPRAISWLFPINALWSWPMMTFVYMAA